MINVPKQWTCPGAGRLSFLNVYALSAVTARHSPKPMSNPIYGFKSVLATSSLLGVGNSIICFSLTSLAIVVTGTTFI